MICSTRLLFVSDTMWHDEKGMVRPADPTELDRVRALAMKLDRPPSPGFITSLREALGLTQAEFGERIGVDKMTVSRWERGALRPGDESLAAIAELRNRAARSGVTIPT